MRKQKQKRRKKANGWLFSSRRHAYDDLLFVSRSSHHRFITILYQIYWYFNHGADRVVQKQKHSQSVSVLLLFTTSSTPTSCVDREVTDFRHHHRHTPFSSSCPSSPSYSNPTQPNATQRNATQDFVSRLVSFIPIELDNKNRQQQQWLVWIRPPPDGSYCKYGEEEEEDNLLASWLDS